MRYHVVCLIISFSSNDAFAKTAEEWSKALDWKKVLEKADTPLTVVVAKETDNPSVPEIPHIKKGSIENISFFRYADPKNIEFSMAINAIQQTKKALPYKIAVNRIFLHSFADAIILQPAKADSKTWYLATKSPKGKSKFKKTRKIAKNWEDPKVLIKWLHKSLGFDGVVVGMQKDMVLVASSVPMLKNDELQGFISPSRGDKGQLIQLVDKYKFFGRFRVILSKSSKTALKPGQRVFFER